LFKYHQCKPTDSGYLLFNLDEPLVVSSYYC